VEALAPPRIGDIGLYGTLRMGRVLPLPAIINYIGAHGRLGLRLIGWEEFLLDAPPECWDLLTDDRLYRADVAVSPLLQLGCWTPGPPGTGALVSAWYQTT
jgi:hypothetical protein